MPDNRKKKVAVVVGEPLSQDVISPDGIVLCRMGTIVTRELIDRLSNWIVEEEERGPREKVVKKKVKKNTRENIIRKLEFQEIISEKTKQETENRFKSFASNVSGGSRKKVSDSVNEINDALGDLIDETSDDPDTPLKLFEKKMHESSIYRHSVECSIIASFVAGMLHYPQHEIASLVLAMMFHDCGLMMTPDEVLNKPGVLDRDEIKMIEGHPQAGWNILRDTDGMDPLALMVALGHHCYADGSGYPDDVDAEDLPPIVHLAIIIDNFEALTAERPYRKAYSLHEAIKILLGHRHKYHPGELQNFIEVVGIYPISTFVLLNSGETGVVVRNNPEDLFMPEIKMVLDPAGKPFSKEVVVNLAEEQDRRILRTVDHEIK